MILHTFLCMNQTNNSRDINSRYYKVKHLYTTLHNCLLTVTHCALEGGSRMDVYVKLIGSNGSYTLNLETNDCCVEIYGLTDPGKLYITCIHSYITMLDRFLSSYADYKSLHFCSIFLY